MGIFCIFDTKFLVSYTTLKILTNSKLAMFWFGKKVESFFTKVQKYFPKIRNYSLTPFEEEAEYPRWAIPDVQSLLFEEWSPTGKARGTSMFFGGIRRSIPSYAQGFGGLSSSHSSTAIGRGLLRRRIKLIDNYG
jgi:hypothetical protein